MLSDYIRTTVRKMVGGRGPPVEFLAPPGDPGLFGPESVAWQVHEDFVSMMVGGISSLVLQALHPRALAGVWDHSRFREDLQGRLGRTAYFIAATTYGGTAMAEAAIARVRHIHAQIRGVDEAGRPYAADEPHLLRWVHLTETRSFMVAHLTVRRAPLSVPAQDRYFAEMQRVALPLGATDLPDTFRGTEAAIAAYREELLFGSRARTVLGLLEQFPAPPAARPVLRLMSRAGLMHLPEWAYPLIERPVPTALERAAVRSALSLAALPIRAALRDGVAAHARRRMQQGR